MKSRLEEVIGIAEGVQHSNFVVDWENPLEV
jgi:hypothetical protein